jgi:hypothetical protein
MSGKLRFSAMAAGVTIALSALAAATPSQAATQLPFSFNNNPSPGTVVGIVSGTNGTLNFTLNVDDPALAKDVAGSFEMDFVSQNGTFASVQVIGDTQSFGASQDLGDAALFPFGGLTNITTWHLDIPADLPFGLSDMPFSLVVMSQLDSTVPFTPILTVDFTGDLQVRATPLPAALGLFASGMGLLGWMGSRRRRKAHAQVQ